MALKLGRFSMSNGVGLLAGAGGALLLLVAGYLIYQAGQGPAPALTPSSAVQAPVADNDDTAMPAPDAGPSAQTAALPTFDLLRIEADGAAIIAGQAAPGSDVHVLLDGVEVGQAQADATGNFVAMLTMPGSQAPQVVTLMAVDQNGGRQNSASSAIIEPTAPVLAEAAVEDPVEDPVENPVRATPETPTQGTDENASTGIQETAIQETVMAQTDLPTAPLSAVKPTLPAPPRVLMAEADGISVVQDGGAGPEALENVTLDAISYDEAGEVQISGRGEALGNVRIYLDNRSVHTTRIAEDGQWRSVLPQVESGIYTLRVDELGADGVVTSRVETPFLREDPAQLAEVAAEAVGEGAGEVADAPQNAAPVQAVTVQPGYTLWAIARDTYGEGMLFVRVFEANRDQIRDPDLIFPGQVFSLPE